MCRVRVHAECDHYRTVRNHAPVESGNLPFPVAFLAWRSTASLSISCCVRSASLCARVLCVASRTASHERGITSLHFQPTPFWRWVGKVVTREPEILAPSPFTSWRCVTRVGIRST